MAAANRVEYSKQTVSGCLITAAAGTVWNTVSRPPRRGLLNQMLTRKYCEILENGGRVGSAKISVTVHDCSKILCCKEIIILIGEKKKLHPQPKNFSNVGQSCFKNVEQTVCLHPPSHFYSSGRRGLTRKLGCHLGKWLPDWPVQKFHIKKFPSPTYTTHCSQCRLRQRRWRRCTTRAKYNISQAFCL